jgi:hypothetical protein
MGQQILSLKTWISWRLYLVHLFYVFQMISR